MYSYNLKSHPERLLIEHLRNVGQRCEGIAKSKNINFSYPKEKLVFVARVMGYTHDLGKGTNYFQQYLDDMIKDGESKVDKTLRSHGFISALYTYAQLRDVDEKLALMAFIIVRKHHGDLENVDIECNFKGIDIKSHKKNVNKQLQNLNSKEIQQITRELSLKYSSSDKILDLIEEVADKAFDFLEELEEIKEIESYILYKFLYSILIFADKEDAIFHRQNNMIYDIPFSIVDSYKKNKFTGEKSQLNEIRDSIYNDVINEIKESHSKIMSITVPTGTGKTLTALSAALNLKQKLNKDMKIIYCLPFTSVIDQNYDVYCNIIQNVLGKDKVTNERILKHHYLSSIDYVSESRNYESNEKEFLVENWDSQIIVTTFMQLFNCIFSNKNRELIKYNSISDSIVLLDEIQSIPYKYWHLINSIFKIMADKLNVYFILITATQPLIFNKSEIKELVEDNEKYFKEFKRTKLNIKKDKIFDDDFIEEMERLIFENPEKSILIILNTVKLAQKIYGKIEKMNLENADIFFLSTGIIPKERKERIDRIKESNKRRIVISTQLIEAGVDIDMDIVVRDMAPLDSINQSAGRCNREYRGEYLGEVYVYNIITSNGKEYNSFIYDPFLINKTKKALENKQEIYEEEYINLNNTYFNLVNEDMTKDDSKKLIEYVNRLKFKDIDNNFVLIEDKEKVSIFIEIDENAKQVWLKYEEIKKEKKLFKRREQFNSIKKDFYNYVISIFKNKVREKQEGGIIYIPYEAVRGVYEKKTGYMLEEKDVIS